MLSTELLTTTQAAARIGVHEDTVRKYIADNILPAQRTAGGHYRIRLSDLAIYLAEHGDTQPVGPAVIAVVHHAGGVGKTTTALNLGYSLAAEGRRVLLVDLDPQGDLSERLGITPTSPSLASILGGAAGFPARATCSWPGSEVRLDLIPGVLDEMAEVETRLMSLPLREQRLARALAPFQRDYDVILLDCPPSLSPLTTNALWAAGSVIIPMQAQDKALRQLPKILGSINEVQAYRDGPPALLGILLTMTARSENMTREVEEALRTGYGDAVFNTTIPRRTRLAEDARYTAPAALYAPRDGAEAYSALAQEVLTRARA
ncbi:MAG: AAA family ATPase [Chloroflexia bacterium]